MLHYQYLGCPLLGTKCCGAEEHLQKRGTCGPKSAATPKNELNQLTASREPSEGERQSRRDAVLIMRIIALHWSWQEVHRHFALVHFRDVAVGLFQEVHAHLSLLRCEAALSLEDGKEGGIHIFLGLLGATQIEMAC